MSDGSRAHIVWSGTNSQIRHPEVFHSSIADGDDEWKNPRAPFFGKNKGRVRKVALGKTRNLMALVFQRNLTQGNDAYEVLLSLSGDQGWSWSGTVEIDNFVSDITGGTDVAVEGRQGTNRPEFVIAWSREFGNVRTANFDIKSTVRPEGTVIGVHDPDAMKVEVGALGKEGFVSVFNNGSGLSTAHVKALIGQVGEGSNFLRGRFGKCFGIASAPFGPSRLAVGSGQSVEAFTSEGNGWKKDDDQIGSLPFDAGNASMEVDMDDDKNLHAVIVKPVADSFQLWYIGQTKKKWGQPELIKTFPDKVDVRGFDIAATKGSVVVAFSQGFEAAFFRRKR